MLMFYDAKFLFYLLAEAVWESVKKLFSSSFKGL